MNIQAYLAQHLQTDQQLYAIIDGAIINNLMGKIYELEDNPSFSPLYKDTLLAGCMEISPCLVAIQYNSAFLNHLINHQAKPNWGVLLLSNQDLTTLTAYCQSLLYATTPKGEDVLFRYYDPRTIKPLMLGSNELERNQLLGPIQQLLTKDPTPESKQTATDLAQAPAKSERQTTEPTIQNWLNWQNTETWHGQLSKQNPWYEISERQAQSLNISHKENAVQAIAKRLVQDNPAFKQTSPDQLNTFVEYWVKQAKNYSINKTLLVIRLIQVMTAFGEHMPEQEFNFLENKILLSNKFTGEEKVLHLEKYAALVYENPSQRFNPVRCLAYDEVYQNAITPRKPIDPFKEEDKNQRLLFMKAYQQILPQQVLVNQAMQAMYQHYGEHLINKQRQFMAISYFSESHAVYRQTLAYYFHQLIDQLQPSSVEPVEENVVGIKTV